MNENIYRIKLIVSINIDITGIPIPIGATMEDYCHYCNTKNNNNNSNSKQNIIKKVNKY